MAAPKAAAPPTSAVTVIEQSAVDSVVEWTLDDFPVERFNRLIPTQTLMIPTDLLRPVVQIVALNPDEKAGDVYSSKDMPSGHAAPTKVGLRKLATAAGISIVDERRSDDGRDPDVIEVTCLAEMLLPTGQRIRATGTKRVDLNAQAWSSPNHRAKFKSFFLEHVSSRAQNRAIRALLSLRGSYPAEVYSRPFAVVSFAPNMAHPEVRARILDAMAPAVGALYGPTSDQRALGPGAPVDVSPAPEEDPAPPTPTALPGERLAAAARASADDEPSWFDAAEPAEHGLLTALRAKAGSSGLAGGATDPQKAQLQAILRPLGLEAVTAVLRAAFELGALNEISAAQAQAVIELSRADDFGLLWAELAEQIGKAAAA
jgi:hypothetical protein